MSQTGKTSNRREGAIKRPSHTTVVAYAALAIAVGTGGAYAVDKITSSDIRDGSIRSADLRDGKAVRGRDVGSNSLTGQHVDEATLDAGQFLKLAGYSDAGSCNPTSSSFTSCLAAPINLVVPSRLLVVATGDQYTADGDPDGSDANCQVRIDGVDRGLSASPGDSGSSTHRGESTNGFARTVITPEPIATGSHDVSLACAEVLPDVRIGTPTLAVLAISAG